MNYPGIGNAVGGAYGPVSPVAWNDTATGRAWSGSAPFAGGGAPANLMFNVPKLTGGDVWTQGYLTFYLSANTTASAYDVQAWFQYFTGNAVTDTHFGGSGVSPVKTISLTAGAPLDPVQVGTFYPYLVSPPTQGIAKPYFIDFTLWNDHSDFLQSAIASANNYNGNGLTAANHQAYSGFRSDINLQISYTGANGGTNNGATLTIYNPLLTMFSQTTYAYKPPAPGVGGTIFPNMHALGIFDS